MILGIFSKKVILKKSADDKIEISDAISFVFSFQGIIDQIQKHKLLFIETQDAAETTLALLNYQKVRFLKI